MKYCIHDTSRRCFHESCSLIDKFGNVSACALHPNPDGFLIHKVSGVSHVSIFSLLKGKGKRVERGS